MAVNDAQEKEPTFEVELANDQQAVDEEESEIESPPFEDALDATQMCAPHSIGSVVAEVEQNQTEKEAPDKVSHQQHSFQKQASEDEPENELGLQQEGKSPKNQNDMDSPMLNEAEITTEHADEEREIVKGQETTIQSSSAAAIEDDIIFEETDCISYHPQPPTTPTRRTTVDEYFKLPQTVTLTPTNTNTNGKRRPLFSQPSNVPSCEDVSLGAVRRSPRIRNPPKNLFSPEYAMLRSHLETPLRKMKVKIQKRKTTPTEDICNTSKRRGLSLDDEINEEENEAEEQSADESGPQKTTVDEYLKLPQTIKLKPANGKRRMLFDKLSYEPSCEDVSLGAVLRSPRVRNPPKNLFSPEYAKLRSHLETPLLKMKVEIQKRKTTPTDVICNTSKRGRLTLDEEINEEEYKAEEQSADESGRNPPKNLFSPEYAKLRSHLETPLRKMKVKIQKRKTTLTEDICNTSKPRRLNLDNEINEEENEAEEQSANESGPQKVPQKEWHQQKLFLLVTTLLKKFRQHLKDYPNSTNSYSCNATTSTKNSPNTSRIDNLEITYVDGVLAGYNPLPNSTTYIFMRPGDKKNRKTLKRKALSFIVLYGEVGLIIDGVKKTIATLSVGEIAPGNTYNLVNTSENDCLLAITPFDPKADIDPETDITVKNTKK